MTKHEQAYQQLNTEYATSHAVYQDRIHNIPEEVRVLSALEKQIKEAESAKEKMEQALETARKNLQQATEEQTKANSNLENAKKQLEETKAKVEQVKAQFQEALSNADFSTEDMIQQVKLHDNYRTDLI